MLSGGGVSSLARLGVDPRIALVSAEPARRVRDRGVFREFARGMMGSELVGESDPARERELPNSVSAASPAVMLKLHRVSIFRHRCKNEGIRRRAQIKI